MRGVWIAAISVAVACGRRGFEPNDSAVAPCGPDGAGCTWAAGPFGACSDSCTTGTQMRTVECHGVTGQVVADTWCDDKSKPSDVQVCMETGCAWTAGAWSPCSVNCGGGAEMRSVECQSSSGIVVPDAYCSGTKPIEMQTCNTQSCCVDLGNPMHELPKDGAQACGVDIRYFSTNDTASETRRCQELGYAQYGNYAVEFTFATWCMYCNARTKIWNGSSWVLNGCTNPVDVLRCCNVP